MSKRTKRIEQKLDQLTNKTFQKARECEEIKNLLRNVKINASPTLRLSEKGVYYVEVSYKIEPVKLYFDSDNEVIKNEKLYSINALNLLSFDDMEKIQQEIEKAKKLNKEA